LDEPRNAVQIATTWYSEQPAVFKLFLFQNHSLFLFGGSERDSDKSVQPKKDAFFLTHFHRCPARLRGESVKAVKLAVQRGYDCAGHFF
jgi:hypothetical protein